MYNTHERWVHLAYESQMPEDWQLAKKQILNVIGSTYSYHRLQAEARLRQKFGMPWKELDQKDFWPRESSMERAAMVCGLLVNPADHPGYYWEVYRSEIESCIAIVREKWPLATEEWEHSDAGMPWWRPRRAGQETRDRFAAWCQRAFARQGDGGLLGGPSWAEV